MTLFDDRRDASVALAAELARYRSRDDVVVLALPRGGVPVAYEVAHALGAPLDVMIVRKLGVPGQEELALGALASGGVRIINHGIGCAHAGRYGDAGSATLGGAFENCQLHRCHATLHHVQVAGRLLAQIDDPTVDEGAAIIDGDDYGTAGIASGNTHLGSTGESLVGRGQSGLVETLPAGGGATVELVMVIAGDTQFGMYRTRCSQSKHNCETVNCGLFHLRTSLVSGVAGRFTKPVRPVTLL